MNAPKKWSIFILLSMVLLVTGCASKEGDPSEVTSEVPTEPDTLSSESEMVEVTPSYIEELIKEQIVWYEYDQVEILEAFNDRFYLIKTQKETFADGYLAYDARDQKIYLMPIGISYVSSYKIVDESKIIFQMTGENSESNYNDVPYVMTCLKAINADGQVEFTSYISKKIAPLEEPIDFGGKSGHVLSEMILNLNGIQFGFKPENLEDAYYFADYTIPPYTKTAYNEAEHTLTIQFNDTILGENLFAGKRYVSNDNEYIESLDFSQLEDAVVLKIELKGYEDYKKLKFYSAEIVNTLTYPAACSITFYNEVP